MSTLKLREDLGGRQEFIGTVDLVFVPVDEVLVLAEIMVEAFVRGLVETSGGKSGKRVGKQVRKQMGKHMGNTWGEFLPGTLEPLSL